MILRRIKHILLRLSTEEKVFAAGAVAVLISAFMPWYSMVFNFNEKSLTESGFSGDLGVIGFIIFLLTAMALVFLMAGYMRIKLPDFGFKKERILMFLMGESAFLVLLTIAIYTKRSLAYTSAELRFGIYIALIGACVGVFASFAQMQKLNKKDAEAFFDHSEEASEDAEEEIADEVKPSKNYAVGTRYTVAEEKPAKKQKPAQAIKEEQKGFFYEEPKAIEDPIGDTIEDPIEDLIEDPVVDPIEDPIGDTIEDPIEDPIGDTPINTTDEGIAEDDEIDLGLDEKSASDQANYFMRDAGIEEKTSGVKVDIGSIKQVEKNKEPTEADNPKMSFYDDL